MSRNGTTERRMSTRPRNGPGTRHPGNQTGKQWLRVGSGRNRRWATSRSYQDRYRSRDERRVNGRTDFQRLLDQGRGVCRDCGRLVQEERRVRTVEVSGVLVLCMNRSISVHTGVHVSIRHAHAHVHGHGIGIAERHEGEVRQRRNHPAEQDARQEGEGGYVLSEAHAESE